MQDDRFCPVTIYLSPVTFKALRLRPLYAHADFVKTGARRDVERLKIGGTEAAVGRDYSGMQMSVSGSELSL